MSVSFANPLWILAALVGVPLLAHLFSRTRPRKREFPSLVLLREAMRRVTRVRRPRDRWLLLLRTLAVAALVLAFLQPWLRSRFGGGSSLGKTAVIVVDSTASMGWADGTRTRLAQAAATAEDVLGSLPAGSHANIVWVRANAAAALPEPGPNFDFLRQSLRQAVALPEGGDAAGALTLALKQLAAADGERELVVLSDFQKSAWQGVRWDVPSGIKLTRIAIGEGDAPNVGLAGLALEPARPVVGQEARLVCRVRNFAAEPRRVTVFAEAGESRLSQVVEVAPWKETLALMPVKFPQDGLVPLKLSLGEDRFPGDDTRYALAEVRGALQVVVAGGEKDATAQTWVRAAGALDGVAARRISPAQIAEARAEILFVAGWRGEALEALRAHIERGNPLVVQPAEGLDATLVRALLGLSSGTDAPLAAEVRDAPGWSLRISNEEHPVFDLFKGGAFGDPAKASFRRRIAVPAFVAAKPILAFDDGKPALSIVEQEAGANRVIAWWNLDLATSDWPSRTAFVPFFGEFLRYLASRAETKSLRTFTSGESLRFDAAAFDPRDVTLVNEKEEAVKIGAESTHASARLITSAPAIPGSYRWIAQGGVLDRAVVNFPDTESDLRRLTDAELAAAGGDLIDNAARARLSELREGRPLWPWCVAAAAFFLLLEGLLLRAFRSSVEALAPPGQTVGSARPAQPLTTR